MMVDLDNDESCQIYRILANFVNTLKLQFFTSLILQKKNTWRYYLNLTRTTSKLETWYLPEKKSAHLHGRLTPGTNWKEPAEEAEGGLEEGIPPGSSAASRLSKIEFKELFSSVELGRLDMV